MATDETHHVQNVLGTTADASNDRRNLVVRHLERLAEVDHRDILDVHIAETPDRLLTCDALHGPRDDRDPHRVGMSERHGRLPKRRRASDGRGKVPAAS